MSKVNLENVVAKDQALAAAIAKGDTAVGALLNQRHNEIVNGETKAIVRFFKPLGDLLCKLRAGLEADQKQIPSKTLIHFKLDKITRQRRSSAERLSRDWNVEVSHMEGKTVGELAMTGKWSSPDSLFNAVDKPEREAKAAERKAAKEAAKAEAEAAEAEDQNEVLIERGSVSLNEIAREALLQCDLHGHDVSKLVSAIDAAILELLDEVHPQVTEAA